MMSRIWSTKFSAAACALAAAFYVAASASAALIVNDTWLDGTRTDPAQPTYSENGVDSDSDGNLESAWYLGGDGTMTVAANGPLTTAFSDPVNGNSSATWTTYFTPEGNEVNLTNAGDSATVTWVFTPIGIGANNTSQNFRIALVDSPAASRIVADGSPGSAAYTGYGIFANMGGTLGNSNPFALVERAAGSAALLSAGAAWLTPNMPLANGATSGNTGYVTDTEYTFVATLTRTALGELQVDMSISGGNLDNDGLAAVSFLDTTPNGGSFKFDTFSIRPSGATSSADEFRTKLFKVEGPRIVPEPASMTLIGLGGMAMIGLLRRRR